MADLFENPRFVEFRGKLEQCGYSLRCLWDAKTGRDPSGKGYSDLALFHVQAPSHKPIAHLTIIVQDYGERDGFGLWLDSRNNTFDGDVAQIAGNAT